MLVKIAKKLGFDGFRSLRVALAEHNRVPLAKVRQGLSGHSTVRAIAEKALRASLKALEEGFSLIPFDELERAAQWLYSAWQRDFYGVGGSAQVARDAACKFLRIGLRASTFDDSLMMLMSASLLQVDPFFQIMRGSGTPSNPGPSTTLDTPVSMSWFGPSNTNALSIDAPGSKSYMRNTRKIFARAPSTMFGVGIAK